MQIAADAVPETHAGVDKLIHSECHRYSRRTGVPVEVVRETAEDCCADAYVRHDPARGRFTTCLVTYIRHGLWKEAQAASRAIPAVPDQVFESIPDDPHREFNLGIFTEDLSSDSAEVIRMLTQDKSERGRCQDLARIEDWVRRGCHATARGALEDLLARLGWSMGRITESFAEIGRALR